VFTNMIKRLMQAIYFEAFIHWPLEWACLFRLL
jgi:hypothetical protein